MILLLLLAIIICIVSGCGSSPEYHSLTELPLPDTQVSYGMTKEEIREILGIPSDIQVNTNDETWVYENINTIFGTAPEVRLTISDQEYRDENRRTYRPGLSMVILSIPGAVLSDAEKALQDYYGPYSSVTELETSFYGFIASQNQFGYEGYQYVWDDVLAGSLNGEEKEQAEKQYERLQKEWSSSAEIELRHLEDDTALIRWSIESLQDWTSEDIQVKDGLVITIDAGAYAYLNLKETGMGEDDPTASGYKDYDPWRGWDPESADIDPRIYIAGAVILAVVAAAVVITLRKKKYKTEKNVRVAAVTEHLNAIPTPISRAGSGGPGTAMMENTTVTFVREDGTDLTLLCSIEEAQMLEEGAAGNVTYSGQELISFKR